MTGRQARPDAPGGTRPRALGAIPVLALLVVLLVAACGAATGTPGSSEGAGTATDAGGTTGASGEPAGSASPSDASGLPGPSPTPWPGGVVEAVVILGKADAQIQAAGGDLGAAAAYQDLKAMWGAADGLATLIARLEGQVDRIRDYPVTAPAATAYDAAFPAMRSGAEQIRDAITAGDGASLTAGFELLAQGTARYQDARREIGPLLEPALLMQRILVK